MTWRAASLAAAVGAAAMSRVAAQSSGTDAPLLVSTDWLASHLADPRLVVIQVGLRDSAYRAGHIPGARFVAYGAITTERGGLSAELPVPDSLRHVFEAAGMSTGSRVVLTGSPLETSRAFFTLEYLGISRVSVLTGGTARWRAEGRRVDQRPVAPAAGHLAQSINPGVVVSADWVLHHLDKPGISYVDVRREGEYRGDEQSATKGHVPGARQLDWADMFADPATFTLKDHAELERMWSALAKQRDTVVVYCRTGHRASAAYFVARALGYAVKLYDGSYEDWAMRGLPLVR